MYVIDSGVDISHPEFQGRAKFGTSFLAKGTNPDTNGHGTHVAGIIASRTYGVAKSANIISVQIIKAGGIGESIHFVKAIEFVFDAVKKSGRPSIIHVSLGRKKDELIERAIEQVVEAGIYVVAASGNEKDDACKKTRT